MKSMFKKILSGLLAVTTVLVLSMPAFAAPVAAVSKLTDITGPAIDEDGNQMSSPNDTIAPGQTIYFLLPPEMAATVSNSTNFKMTFRKATNAKLVSKVALTEKRLPSGKTYSLPNKLTDPAYPVTNGVASGNRNTYVAITLNNTTSDQEYKVEVDVSFAARKAGNYPFRFGTGTTNSISTTPTTTTSNPPIINAPSTFASNEKMTFRASFYVANSESRGDTDVTVQVGNKVQTIKPVANDLNTISFEAGSENIAVLSFKASSNPSKFSAQLSNKWTSALASRFSHAEALIWRFAPTTIDTTSRATLALTNMFDEDSGINPKNVYIYTVSSDGRLTNVTSSFSYSSDDNAYLTKTRALGTYIISDRKAK